MDPKHAIRLLRARPDHESQEIAAMICTLPAVLGQACQSAANQPRSKDSYETNS